MATAVLVEAVRTPLGKRNGRLKEWRPWSPAGTRRRSPKGALGRAKLSLDDIDVVEIDEAFASVVLTYNLIALNVEDTT